MTRVLLLLSLLLVVAMGVSGLRARPHYARALYPHWTTEDGCRDTRQKVLIRDSQEPVVFRDPATACVVARGRWSDPYSGTIVTDPGTLDIDHLWPLKAVHGMGGATWSRDRRRAYANDLTYRWTLLAVRATANRAKGARGPATWVPDNAAFHCQYGQALATVAVLWNLRVGEADRAAIHALVQTC